MTSDPQDGDLERVAEAIAKSQLWSGLEWAELLESERRFWRTSARAALSMILTPLTDDDAIALIVARMHDCPRPSEDYAAWLLDGYRLVPKETP